MSNDLKSMMLDVAADEYGFWGYTDELEPGELDELKSAAEELDLRVVIEHGIPGVYIRPLDTGLGIKEGAMRTGEIYTQLHKLEVKIDSIKGMMHNEYQRRLVETTEPEFSKEMRSLWNTKRYLEMASSALRAAQHNFTTLV